MASGSSRTPRSDYLDHPWPLAIAHRGGAVDAAENSFEAFATAVSMGYRYLETDVHVTADGVLVAFHDESLDRVTDATGMISDLPWAEVGQARIDGVAPIPRFDELVESFPGIRWNIDPKSDGAVGPLIETIQRHAIAERVCVGSFSDRRLSDVRRAFHGAICLGLGPRGVARLRAASVGLPGGRFDHASVAQVPTHARGVPVVDARFVRTAHARGLAVHVWTIDDAGEMHHLLDIGVDGIMTDRPGVLKAVLEQRGQWPGED